MTTAAIAEKASEKTPKGERTRERILEAALTLFAEKGYAAATMRDIAKAADCSLGLAYRYFARKEDMVLALYERLADELAEEAERLPPGSMAERWARVERADIARLAPHRESLAALFGAGLAPDAPTQVLGPNVGGIRERVIAVFGRVVEGATDRPRSPATVVQLTTVLYAGHLALVLFWLQDRTEGQKATADLIDWGRESLARLRPILGLPWVAKSLSRLASILGPLFGPGGGGAAPQG
jgi:AcrR family transcriptional regulator